MRPEDEEVYIRERERLHQEELRKRAKTDHFFDKWEKRLFGTEEEQARRRLEKQAAEKRRQEEQEEFLRILWWMFRWLVLPGGIVFGLYRYLQNYEKSALIQIAAIGVSVAGFTLLFMKRRQIRTYWSFRKVLSQIKSAYPDADQDSSSHAKWVRMIDRRTNTVRICPPRYAAKHIAEYKHFELAQPILPISRESRTRVDDGFRSGDRDGGGGGDRGGFGGGFGDMPPQDRGRREKGDRRHEKDDYED